MRPKVSFFPVEYFMSKQISFTWQFKQQFLVGKNKLHFHIRAVVSGGAGGALAPPEFGTSLNPIPARGGRLCPPHYW